MEQSKPGRKSAASLSVVPPTDISVMKRPDPPADMPAAQRKHWDKISASLPVGWFTNDNTALLAIYCHHIVNSERLSPLVEAAFATEPLDIGLLNNLLNRQAAESRAILQIATKMRITPLAKFKARKFSVITNDMPWEE